VFHTGGVRQARNRETGTKRRIKFQNSRVSNKARGKNPRGVEVKAAGLSLQKGKLKKKPDMWRRKKKTKKLSKEGKKLPAHSEAGKGKKKAGRKKRRGRHRFTLEAIVGWTSLLYCSRFLQERILKRGEECRISWGSDLQTAH